MIVVMKSSAEYAEDSEHCENGSVGRDLFETCSHRCRILRSNDTRHFDTVTKKHKCGPQLHCIRTAERPALTVFDLGVSHSWKVSEALRDEGLRCLAETAPRCPELEDCWTLPRIDVGA